MNGIEKVKSRFEFVRILTSLIKLDDVAYATFSLNSVYKYYELKLYNKKGYSWNFTFNQLNEKDLTDDWGFNAIKMYNELNKLFPKELKDIIDLQDLIIKKLNIQAYKKHTVLKGEFPKTAIGESFFIF